ncbi:lymphatic vessel endothelial hyaluronic acid receptor 1a isoform X2 [Austrofundulus limnaeus]|uniref:Lymphatic vessel endothelial hyaluronic acid receptor 1a isoform X2 n=1 Tax=Austrofundulus limnaeus TaxID=52670 RepID=A0A2I4CQU7_AUSLI|nr:PREDICTED: lymphatic vessel endothelial hyaluronic acid receptor 1 isoform X2 [Austrofundulus limnaeus]
MLINPAALSPVIMTMIWLSVTSLLSIAPVFSDRNVSQIRVFPAGNQSVAGVIQVSYLNDWNQVKYAYDAVDARSLCSSLGLQIASKAQVEKALSRGLETCRFGWIDEHLAVIPRIHALANCGKNQTGLVPWRASLTQKFDVFCFNESDAATQLKDATTDSPLSTSSYSKTSTLPSEAAFSQGTPSEEASSEEIPFKETPPEEASSKEAPSQEGDWFLTPKTTIYEVEPARFVSSTHSSTGAKIVLITCTCGLLLALVAVIMYIKLKNCSLGSDQKQQQPENIQTQEWKCENDAETKINVQEDQKIHDEDSTQ